MSPAFAKLAKPAAAVTDSDAAMTHPSPPTGRRNVASALQPQQLPRLGQRRGLRSRYQRGRWAALLIAAIAVVALSASVVAGAAAVGAFDPQRCVKCAGLQYCTNMNGQILVDPVAGYSRCGWLCPLE
jgi:hypothetical protein